MITTVEEKWGTYWKISMKDISDGGLLSKILKNYQNSPIRKQLFISYLIKQYSQIAHINILNHVLHYMTLWLYPPTTPDSSYEEYSHWKYEAFCWWGDFQIPTMVVTLYHGFNSYSWGHTVELGLISEKKMRSRERIVNTSYLKATC